ncbi:MAG TPA: PDZ domain-containing protein [Steroidobacteraceae bacterium]|nr:PDZ domain-containing protein [Steroidobacteraceae bacterium]
MSSRLAAFLALMLAAQGAFASRAALSSLSAEHFRDTAAVHEDPATGTTTISTEPGFVRRGPLGTVWNDEYLTSRIDRATGRKSFQIDVSVTYSGAWRAYESASYPALEGTKTVTPTLLEREAVNCPVGECIYTEHLVIPVGEELLRHLAAGYVPGRPVLWTFRLSAKRGADYRGSLSNAEIAGLLERVDAYAQGPVAAVTVIKPQPPAAAPRRLDLGISGLAVSPAAENPERAGVLVVAVSSGSMAQKAGIITGDIIDRFGARAIRSLADLEAAMAASAGQSKAVIHLYRGTNEMSLRLDF